MSLARGTAKADSPRSSSLKRLTENERGSNRTSLTACDIQRTYVVYRCVTNFPLARLAAARQDEERLLFMVIYLQFRVRI